jgi:hypothetical protein
MADLEVVPNTNLDLRLQIIGDTLNIGTSFTASTLTPHRQWILVVARYRQGKLRSRRRRDRRSE